MERRKCRRCGHPMTRIITQTIKPGGSSWKACYTCLSCGHKIAAAPAGSQAEAEKGLEDFATMIDQGYETAGRSAAQRKPDRLLKVYDLYCQLCETLTGEDIPEPDVLRAALQKAKRELEAYKGAGLRYEAEIARLKRMAAEDILRAALSGYPCDSCVNNTLDVLCDCEECADCERHCTCYECHDNESYVWRGGK
nr:MAG TPA: RNA polymerase-like protein [Caudoviricetes sp.]